MLKVVLNVKSIVFQTGLWQRLGIAYVGDRKLHVRILLAEHCEFLHVAAALKNLHQDYQALLDAAIRHVFDVFLLLLSLIVIKTSSYVVVDNKFKY